MVHKYPTWKHATAVGSGAPFFSQASLEEHRILHKQLTLKKQNKKVQPGEESHHLRARVSGMIFRLVHDENQRKNTQNSGNFPNDFRGVLR